MNVRGQDFVHRFVGPADLLAVYQPLLLTQQVKGGALARRLL
eukprot:CAMPEP_0118991160 /NCGR_PEP_ID=MMETSP1173-20130426/51173_1 /TAXON_ID=1034831 /ORGANISM="Rhizochromulina marina cf, Strain CCMP1243" /LENGTH=41 /DNA_ID= /DNA_START= /DNA_END= /DNA_ORIENTATION=